MAGSEEKGLKYQVFKRKYPNWMYAILFVVYIILIAAWVLSQK